MILPYIFIMPVMFRAYSLEGSRHPPRDGRGNHERRWWTENLFSGQHRNEWWDVAKRSPRKGYMRRNYDVAGILKIPLLDDVELAQQGFRLRVMTAELAVELACID